jgi:hypothetical protein
MNLFLAYLGPALPLLQVHAEIQIPQMLSVLQFVCDIKYRHD